MSYSQTCPLCSNLRVALVRRDQHAFTCPACHTTFAEVPLSLTRTAQYGGKSGGSNSGGGWAPGSSPFGKGGGSGSSINQHVVDEGLDAIMSRTHMPMPIDPTRNMEKRLEPMHNQTEEDEIPYHLSLNERMRLRIQKEIRRRDKAVSDCADSIHKNSPAYIQEHFQPKQEHMQGMEENLEKRRFYKDNAKKDPREDESPPQDKPTRIHSVASLQHRLQRTAGEDDIIRGTGRMQGDGSEEDDPEDPTNIENQRRHNIPMGRTPLLTEGSDLDNYLQKSGTEDWGGSSMNGNPGSDVSGPNATTLISDYPGMDEIGDHSAPKTPGIASPVNSPETANNPGNSVGAGGGSSYGSVNDPYQGIESKMDKLHREPQGPPHDPYSSWSESDWKNQGKEPQGLSDTYNQKNLDFSGGSGH